MSQAPSLQQVRNVFEKLGPPGTPFTTSEVATKFDCTDRTIYNKLDTLAEEGVLATKKVGARGRVWWQPIKRQDKSEQEIDKKYRELFQSINQGFCLIEVLFDDDQPVDYRFLETNSVFNELTGLEDVEGKRIREVDSDHEDHWFQRYGAVALTGEPIQFIEYAKNLGDRWYEIDAFRAGDPAENIVALLFDDVTNHKRTKHSVHRGEQPFNALVEATTEGIYRISPDWSEIYQVVGEKFVVNNLSNTWQDYVPADEQERVEQAIDVAIETQSPLELEHRIERADGTIGWTHSRAVPILEDGDIVEWFGTATDITERKEQERKQKQVISRVTDGIFELNTDWEFTFVSEQAEELLDTSNEEIVDRYIWDVFEDARGTPFEKRYSEVMATREPTSFEEYYSGLDSWFEVQAYPNEDGGVAVYFRDVTERKERKQAQKRAEQRYQKLIELAPVPILAVDPTTEKILEANEAAGELIDCSAAELTGRVWTSLHPSKKSDSYGEIFRKVTERGGTWRRLPDGSPTQIVTEYGEKIPVEITGKKVELEGGDVAYGILQDISDQLEYQHRLQSLNEITHELFDAETEREVTQTAVEALAEVLDVSTVAFYSFDEGAWEFGPDVHTTSSRAAEEIEEPPVFESGVGVEWRAFTDGQTAIVDDFRTRETDYEFDREIRSEVAVPIADWGVLVAGDTRPDMFDDWTVNLVETLGATTRSALNYSERERELREQRQKLQEIELLNEQIRDITHTIVKADSRTELEQSVCERLIASDAIEFGWIGNVDLENKSVTPRAQAGTGGNYLDSVPLTLGESTDPEPSVQALQSRDACTSSNIATNIQHGDWRSTAVERGFRSALSVPLIYRDAFYGTLTVYSRTTSVFSGALESVLQELCDLIAHASAAIEQKEALQATQATELEFEVRDKASLFCRLATVLECNIDLERVLSQEGKSTLAFIRVANGTPEELLKEAERLEEIDSCRLIEQANNTFIQLRITEPCIGSVLSGRGLILRQLFADSTRCRLTVEVPKSFDTRRAVNIVMSRYEDAQLLAKRESDASFESEDQSYNITLDALTPRQREVVETAYRSGYFDSPRRASGKELAEAFDFSNSTFHEHIRKAEQTLFKNLIEDTNGSLVT